MLSHKKRLYLHLNFEGCTAVSAILEHLVVEPSSIRGLAADYRF